MFKEEKEVLKTAIINEQEGYQFYLLASEKAESQELKTLFTGLAAEEAVHEKWLRKAYQDIITNAGIDLNPEETRNASPHIFTAEKMKGGGGLLVSALHVGVLMEKESMDFYRNAAARTSNGSLADMLLRLAEWEKAHLDFLENAYDWARNEWWDSQGFSGS